MLNRKMIFTMLFVCLTAALIATACMRSNENNDTNAPQASQMPAYTLAPSVTSRPESGYDWVNNASEIENRISRFSEVSESRVIVNGNTALVAVRFASAYQGELTSRIREMIAGEIMAADPTIKTVAVTSESEDVNRVYEISDRIRAGETVDTMEKDIDEIVRNTTTLS